VSILSFFNLLDSLFEFRWTKLSIGHIFNKSAKPKTFILHLHSAHLLYDKSSPFLSVTDGREHGLRGPPPPRRAILHLDGAHLLYKPPHFYPLQMVANMVSEGRPPAAGPFVLRVPYPRREFGTATELSTTLREAGLAVSACLNFTRAVQFELYKSLFIRGLCTNQHCSWHETPPSSSPLYFAIYIAQRMGSPPRPLFFLFSTHYWYWYWQYRVGPFVLRVPYPRREFGTATELSTTLREAGLAVSACFILVLPP